MSNTEFMKIRISPETKNTQKTKIKVNESQNKSLSNKLICQDLDKGNPIHLLTTVSDTGIFMEILIDSMINDDFFDNITGKYDVWGDDNKRKFHVTLKKSQEQLNIKIVPVFIKKKDKIIYNGYMPYSSLKSFIEELKTSTDTFIV